MRRRLRHCGSVSKGNGPALTADIHIDSQDRRDATGRNGYYYPIVYFNEFWQLKDHMMRVNESVR